MIDIEPGYLVGYEQLSQYIRGTSKKTLRRWVRDGKIPHQRISQKIILFRVADVDRALEDFNSAMPYSP